MKGSRIKAFVLAIDLAGLLALILLARPETAEYWIGTFLLATLIALAGATPVRVPALKVKVSATDPFIFTALASAERGIWLRRDRAARGSQPDARVVPVSAEARLTERFGLAAHAASRRRSRGLSRPHPAT